MTEESAIALIRASFQPDPDIRGLGVRHSRLLYFASELLRDIRSNNLAKFLMKCAGLEHRAEWGASAW